MTGQTLDPRTRHGKRCAPVNAGLRPAVARHETDECIMVGHRRLHIKDERILPA